MLNFLKASMPIKQIPEQEIPRTYKKCRLQVFLSIYLGYMFSYFVRSNFAFAKNYFIDQGFSLTEIGFVASAIGISIAISRLMMGIVSDRANPRYFFAIAIIMSGLLNFFIPNTNNVYLMFMLVFLNGWFQGMCWPPCAKTIAYWFSQKERGVKTTLWDTSHNLSGGLVSFICLLGINLFNTWKGIFYLPAISAIIIGILFMIFSMDSPQSVGLPPIEKFKGEVNSTSQILSDKQKSLIKDKKFFRYILKHKLLWTVVFASTFTMFIRYGILNWIPVYLRKELNWNEYNAFIASSAFEYAAIPVGLVMGWLSDNIFHGRRAPISILNLAVTFIGILVYSRSNDFWTVVLSIALIGACINTVVTFIGISAVDLVVKEAVGVSTGLTSFVSYLVGQVLAESLMSFVAEHLGWNTVFIVLLICCVLAILFCCFTWNANNLKLAEGNKKSQ